MVKRNESGRYRVQLDETIQEPETTTMYTVRKAVTGPLNTMEIFDEIHSAILEVRDKESFHSIISVVTIPMRSYIMATIWYQVTERPVEGD